MDGPETGVLSGYNARSASWREVADGFVAPPQYWQLVDRGNQRLIGARGIGKTTLLRMLCSPALEYWQDLDGEAARAAVRFTGVLVPANKMWSGQLAALTGPLPQPDRGRFGLSAFAHMALRALVEAAEHRVHGPSTPTPHRRVKLDSSQEAELAGRAAEAFGAPPGTASLRALRLSLSESVAALGRLLRRVANPSLGAGALEEILASPLLDLDFYSASALFTATFDDLVGEPESSWAFLLDELEFLPPAARLEIAESVQGQDPRLTFKVSLAPWRDLLSQMPGMPFHDFTQVDLMPRRREEAHDFATRLFTREMANRGRAGSAVDFLGPGGFEPPSNEDAWGPNGESRRAVAELADIDPGFASWIRARGMDAKALDGLNSAEYGQLRKAGPLARLRLAYSKTGAREKRVGRPRKRPDDLYAGVNSIWAMSEGNPRWLKAFAHELFARHTGPGSALPGVQLEAVLRVANNYLGYFRAMDSDLVDELPPLTPYALLERLGGYFRESVHGPEFTADPVTMVRPDADDAWLVALVDALVFLGGLVRGSDAEGESLRLAHMFAPHFRLPLRNGRAIPLTRALARVSGHQMSIGDEAAMPGASPSPDESEHLR